MTEFFGRYHWRDARIESKLRNGAVSQTEDEYDDEDDLTLSTQYSSLSYSVLNYPHHFSPGAR